MTSDKSSANNQTENIVPQDKKQVERQYPIPRGPIGYGAYFFGMTMTRLLIKLRFFNRDNFPVNTPYVIAANHQTYVDGMWIGAALPSGHFKKMACIAGKDLEDKHGLLGKLIVKVGRAIAIDRFGNPIRGLIIAKKKVDEGNILLVHPEGTRSHDGRLAEMKDGAAYIAVKSKVPLVPVYIEGGYSVFPRQSKWPKTFDRVKKRKKRVNLYIGKPLLPADYANAKEMTAALIVWMKQMEKQTLAASNGNSQVK
ncbi:MAG: 1-acyl-sn-glycerol-3-phosphate acyltransferase [Clostridiaceae bacterium]|nr:1-acyl-sn-glycerol-3-phosphate acyltransferase [Clostridiaceae bacterium]